MSLDLNMFCISIRCKRPAADSNRSPWQRSPSSQDYVCCCCRCHGYCTSSFLHCPQQRHPPLTTVTRILPCSLETSRPSLKGWWNPNRLPDPLLLPPPKG